PKEKKAHPSSVAAEAVRYFDRIYHEEGLLVNMTADERYKERLAKIKPLLDGLFARLETVQISGKSAFAKAVRYALHEKPYFYTFLQDGNVPPDNNRAENAIRPFAIGRKNWLFSNTASLRFTGMLYIILPSVNGIMMRSYICPCFSYTFLITG
ncbi:MAG: transposase, partial [Paludibacteraceae bacterium]|nr:transposase [Paludibacteraceae bacterium]